MLQDFIYHISSAEQWSQISNKKYYEAESLLKEGFIHFSFFNQVDGVIKRYYKNLENLIVIKVETSKLQSELRIENVAGAGNFPHLYGMLNMNAVVGFYEIKCDKNGDYYWTE